MPPAFPGRTHRTEENLDSEDRTKSAGAELPFGAMTPDSSGGTDNGSVDTERDGKTPRKDWRKPERRRGAGRRGGRRRRRSEGARQQGAEGGEVGTETAVEPSPKRVESEAPRDQETKEARPKGGRSRGAGRNGSATRTDRRPKKKGRGKDGRGPGQGSGHQGSGQREKRAKQRAETGETTGLFLLDRKGGAGFLRRAENDFIPKKDDVHVPQRMVQRFKLRDGMLVEGTCGPGHGKHKRSLTNVAKIDGEDPKHWQSSIAFKNLTSIDPDFHYAVGDAIDNVSMKHRRPASARSGAGQRGLIVAPPRSRQDDAPDAEVRQGAIEDRSIPEVHLFVLLVDERPGGGHRVDPQRRRAARCSSATADETSEEPHPARRGGLEALPCAWWSWARTSCCCSTRSRAWRGPTTTQMGGGSGRTMSGGLDTPRHGAARARSSARRATPRPRAA